MRSKSRSGKFSRMAKISKSAPISRSQSAPWISWTSFSARAAAMNSRRSLKGIDLPTHAGPVRAARPGYVKINGGDAPARVGDHDPLQGPFRASLARREESENEERNKYENCHDCPLKG